VPLMPTITCATTWLQLAQQLAVPQQHSKSGNLQSRSSQALEAENGKLKTYKADNRQTHSTSGIKYELYAPPGSVGCSWIFK